MAAYWVPDLPNIKGFLATFGNPFYTALLTHTEKEHCVTFWRYCLVFKNTLLRGYFSLTQILQTRPQTSLVSLYVFFLGGWNCLNILFSFSYIFPLIFHKFCHNIDNESKLWIQKTTQTTVTMLLQNSLSVAGEMHEKLPSMFFTVRNGPRSRSLFQHI